MLEAYYNAALPGTFEVVKRDDGVDILPGSLTGIDGSEKKVTPIMSRLVSFPNQERSVAATFQALVDSLSSASGKRILLGNVPFPDDLTVSIGATNEVATSVLSKISSALRPISFFLLYEPNG